MLLEPVAMGCGSREFIMAQLRSQLSWWGLFRLVLPSARAEGSLFRCFPPLAIFFASAVVNREGGRVGDGWLLGWAGGGGSTRPHWQCQCLGP